MVFAHRQPVFVESYGVVDGVLGVKELKLLGEGTLTKEIDSARMFFIWQTIESYQ